MNMRYLTVSMVAVTLLFTACGGGGGGGGGGDETPTESAVSIKNGVKSFKAVAGERKFVTMSTGKDVITDGEPNSVFSVISVDSGATATFDATTDKGKNYGNLRFESSNPGTYNVVVTVKNSAGTSAETTFTFEVVSEDAANNTPKVEVLSTTRSNFTRDNSTQFNVQDNATGLTWIDANDVDSFILRTYDSAKEAGCQSPWRLPTLNELLDIVDYSKPYLTTSMLPDTFTKINQTNKMDQYLWAEDKNGRNYFVNTYLGMSFVDTAGQTLSYKCVQGDKKEEGHIISTNIATGATHDYTTKLKWSKASLVDGKAGAESYCGGRLQEDTNWRLPTINELRSVAEDGIMPSGIVTMNTGAQHLTLFSSTTSNDTTPDAKPMHYGLMLNWDRTEPLVLRFFDEGENAKYSATCVKPF